MSSNEIFDHRKNKFLKIGRDGGLTKSSRDGEASLEFKESALFKFKRLFSNRKFTYTALGFALLAIIIVILN